jgi:hypothetical protein
MTAEAEAEWEALNAALEVYTPPCRGEALFTAERLKRVDLERLEATCARCLVSDLCDDYATQAKEPTGFWGGRKRSLRV